MRETVHVLDTLSEWYALTATGNIKNVIVLAVEYKGAIDESVRISSIRKAVRDFHQLGCCLKEIRKGFRRFLVWTPRPDLDFPIIVTDLRRSEKESTVFDTVLERLKPRLDRDWNLFEELPGEYHVIRIAEDHQVSALILHHAAGAAISAGEVMARVAAYYQQNTGDSEAEKILRTPIVSAPRRDKEKSRGGVLRKAVHQLRLAGSEINRTVTVPVGAGSSGDKDQHCVKRTLTQEDTARLNDRSDDGIRLIDRLVASVNFAIDSWNQGRNGRSGLIATSVTVNLKDRYEGAESDNSLGFIFFKLQPHQRTDRMSCARLVSQSRNKQLRKQSALSTLDAMRFTLNSMRVLPFGARRKLITRLSLRYRHSVGISLIGVALPQMETLPSQRNSPSFNSGGVALADIHGVLFKFVTTTPIAFFVYELKGRLNVVMTALASLFTRSEADEFIDLFVDIARSFQEDSQSSH